MKRSRIRTTLALAGALTFADGVAHQVTASAEIAQCGNTAPSNYHAGYADNRAHTVYEGVFAQLTVRYGAVCDSDKTLANFTNAYTMIADGGGGGGYAQSGFLRVYNGTIRHFVQQNDGINAPYTWYSTFALNPGDKHNYKQAYVPSCGCIASSYDSTVVHDTTWDPYSDFSFFNPQYSGETYYKQSDMPGLSGSPTLFASVEGQRSSDDKWEAQPCGTISSYNDDTQRWTVSGCSNSSFSVYTYNTH